MKCKLVPMAPAFSTSAPSFPHPRDIVTGLCACRGQSGLRGHCVHCVRWRSVLCGLCAACGHSLCVVWSLCVVINALYEGLAFNPFTAPACTISGLNDAQTRQQTYMFRSYNTSTFNAMHFYENPFKSECEKENEKP